MTTKEYVKKYKLDISDKFNHSEFCQDLANEFIVLLEYNKADNNIKGFDNAVRCIRMKYDSISNKTRGILPEKLWNYFFATVIVKLREEMCPNDMEQRRKKQEYQKIEWEKRKAYKEWENAQFNDFYWSQNFFSFLFSQTKTDIPTKSFGILGLTEKATEEEVKNSYRKLANLYHPDKGGKQDEFIKITESKNKCLRYLSKE